MTEKIDKPPIDKSPGEWRGQLSDLAYKVAREGATEPAFSHDNFPSQTGVFYCVCCGRALFDSGAKFDSGSGWPSFFAPMSPETLGQKTDTRWFMRRTEVHCSTCNAHLGHVFDDGPKPTGLRYCVNGVTLAFKKSD
ncbi:MAG: peptide-methionine (R)-S-oxide reductase MsrB [Alphaproteobacteria bacterium]|nr:peptide-methionine (R)-S-oxide reductase MsrB [Alphaproteobacteria bacterium]